MTQYRPRGFFQVFSPFNLSFSVKLYNTAVNIAYMANKKSIYLVLSQPFTSRAFSPTKTRESYSVQEEMP